MAAGSPEELAAALAASVGPVRFVGGATKLAWSAPPPAGVTDLSTTGLDRVIEHNAGDLTAVLEAGIPLARAQAIFAEAGQMLALDPPDPGGATVGGVVATADSGPLRARYGSVRDLVVGVRVALSDGTIARAGGKVIKNVAGYDLSKLFAGSFGTLGAILEVSVRLHPLPPETATALGSSSDPDALGRGALALSHAPLEYQGLDVRWQRGHGAVLVRFGGAQPAPQAEAAERLLRAEGLECELVAGDEDLWSAQRDGQRSSSGTVVRVCGVQTQLPALLRAAERAGASVVGRAGLGLSWLRLEERAPTEAAAAVAELRRALSPSPCVVQDGPAALERMGPVEAPALALMRRVKERFDPAG
ncbi:MAG TPA: FAD-binding oxidoreductase, partial [Thermoleophilaceae bacterium]|nr:FAD-binding oxidoreductase [Thermoleophilaceae bacterium]